MCFLSLSIARPVRTARVGGGREDAPATREAEEAPEKPGAAKQKPGGRREQQPEEPGTPQSQERMGKIMILDHFTSDL